MSDNAPGASHAPAAAERAIPDNPDAQPAVIAAFREAFVMGWAAREAAELTGESAEEQEQTIQHLAYAMQKRDAHLCGGAAWDDLPVTTHEEYRADARYVVQALALIRSVGGEI